MARNKSLLHGVLAQKDKSKKTNDDVSVCFVELEQCGLTEGYSTSFLDITCISRHLKW